MTVLLGVARKEFGIIVADGGTRRIDANGIAWGTHGATKIRVDHARKLALAASGYKVVDLHGGTNIDCGYPVAYAVIDASGAALRTYRTSVAKM